MSATRQGILPDRYCSGRFRDASALEIFTFIKIFTQTSSILFSPRSAISNPFNQFLISTAAACKSLFYNTPF